LVTGGFNSFAAVGAGVATYGATIVGPRQSIELEPFRWVNIFICNFKTAIRGTYHQLDYRNYRYRYLAEVQYRVNRPFDLQSWPGACSPPVVRTAPCPKD
jgi:hypothetical protein